MLTERGVRGGGGGRRGGKIRVAEREEELEEGKKTRFTVQHLHLLALVPFICIN